MKSTKKQVAPMKKNEEHPLIVMVARFEVPKRQDLLLETLAEFFYTPWRLQFIDDGSLRPRLEKFITDKGLMERVSFLVNQLDVTSLQGYLVNVAFYVSTNVSENAICLEQAVLKSAKKGD
ncbi:hypothetical protein MWJ95_17285 [Lysinibacillus sp. Bpr_S20]|nr:hypothetical protein [Lysinibacillus sp. Bpr_S20]